MRLERAIETETAHVSSCGMTGALAAELALYSGVLQSEAAGDILLGDDAATALHLNANNEALVLVKGPARHGLAISGCDPITHHCVSLSTNANLSNLSLPIQSRLKRFLGTCRAGGCASGALCCLA